MYIHAVYIDIPVDVHTGGAKASVERMCVVQLKRRTKTHKDNGQLSRYGEPHKHQN
jgi:hypothetical protein